MDEYTTTVPLKCCKRGDQCINPEGNCLPATQQYFHRSSDKPDGLYQTCKVCKNAADRAREQRIRESKPKPTCQNCGEVISAFAKHNLCKVCMETVAKKRQHDWYEQNKPRILEERRARYYSDPEAARRKSREWHHANPEKARAQGKKWRANNPDRQRVNWERWRRENPEGPRAAGRRYRKNHPEVSRAATIRRRARKRGLENSFYASDWFRSLEYWGNRCAVCGKTEDFWTVLAQDHWIPLSKGGGTTPNNIVPLCHPRKGAPAGVISCNVSKWDKYPDQWLIERFGKRKAKRILEAVHAYFEWMKN